MTRLGVNNRDNPTRRRTRSPLLRGDIKLGVKARYKAIVHRGDGEAIRESGWSDNLLLSNGIDVLLRPRNAADTADLSDKGCWCVVGAGNTAASMEQTSLASYLGKASSVVSVAVDRQYATPPYTYKVTRRFRFYPNTDTIAWNVSEAGLCFVDSAADPRSLTSSSAAVHSRALILDDFGDPTTISVNFPGGEYLDIIHEWTWYVMTEWTSTMNLSIHGVPTSHDIVLRPSSMDAPADSNSPYGWGTAHATYATEPAVGGTSRVQTVYGTTAVQNSVRGSTIAGNGSITTAGDVPGFAFTQLKKANSLTPLAYTLGTHYRDWDVVWSLTNGNGIAGGLNLFNFLFLFGEWQMSVDPAIDKTSDDKLRLRLRFSIANVP